MRIEKNGHAISSIEEWGRLAGPKASHQWVEGRSAYELARAWAGTGSPVMPVEVRALLDSRPETAGLTVETVFPEHPIAFDARPGEPRNADLAFLAENGRQRVAVTIEAKADEPFGTTVGDTLHAAVARWMENERSGGVARVFDLIQSILPRPPHVAVHAGTLRYQLLTAVAGTLAFAAASHADAAVLLVHEFTTDKTRSELQAKNHQDYLAFLGRLASSVQPDSTSALFGPLRVPGAPLFERPVPLFLGMVSTSVGLAP